ncbi:MAG: hypothetical protein WEC59_11180 [Salibacteraceae bacterium]
MQEFSLLKKNIEAYNRRFYTARLLSGALVAIGVITGLFLVFVLLEHFLRLNQWSRAILFFGFTISSFGVLAIQVIKPFFQMIGWIKGREEPEVAKAIGNRIPTIEDKLLNVLNLSLHEAPRNTLIYAGLAKKTSELNAFDFSKAVDLKASLVWLKYTLIPLSILFVVSLWNPSIISDSTNRLLKYNQDFTPPAPFSFAFINERFEVPEGENFELKVKTTGNSVPEQAFIILDGKEVRMKKDDDSQFSFTFNNVSANKSFRIRAASVYSNEVELVSLAKPKMLRSEAYLSYPLYTNRKNETFVNRTNLVIPEGTNVKWKFDIKNSKQPRFYLDSGELELERSTGTILLEDRFIKTSRLRLFMTSESNLSDSAFINIEVVKDAYPKIDVISKTDSIRRVYYFNGELSDDYGISDLKFVVLRNGDPLQDSSLQFDRSRINQGFSHVWNPDTLLQNAGDELEYYFEVADNDGVNGVKTSKSQMFKIKAPTKEELRDQNEAQSKETKSALEERSKSLEELNEELEKVRKELLQKKKADWEDKNQLKSLLEKKKQIAEEIERKAQQQRSQMEQSQQFEQYSDELKQKQERLQEMFEELFDEEFREKYEEYNKLLEEFNKDEMLDKLDQMKLDNEALENEMDRTLELFKELEFEKKVQENIQRLEELRKEQDELSNETESGESERDDLENKQEGLKEKFEKLEEELEKMEELNEALESPKSTPDLKQEQQDAKDAMSEAKEELSKGKDGKASKAQKKAEEAMKKMQDKLSDFQESQSSAEQTENLEDMRQLLENIVDLSIEQEVVMEELKYIKANNPKYVELAKDQKKLMDDIKIVEDSLLALSKRVPQIDKVINKELTSVKYSMEKSLSFMTNQPPNQERQYTAYAAERQQYSMTALNNLAVLFDEIIKQMQQQMASKMKGSGQCEKPGSGQGAKPSAGDMKKMQKSLSKQLQDLKDAMEKGENPNGKKPGQQKGDGFGGMSKELARMAAQQAAIRQQLREMSGSLGGEKGQRAGDQMKEIDRLMEQTEEDILFNKINAETMKRQEEILTRLLKSENAEREQEMDKKRESKSADDNFAIPKDVWEDFEKEKQKEIEFFKTVPPNLKPFYRNEVNRYFSTF